MSRVPRVRRRWIVLLVVLVLVLVVLRGADNPSRIDYYRFVDDHTLIMGTSEGPGAWTRVTNVTESAESVSVTVTSFLFAPGPRAAYAVQVETLVKLVDPLGTRTVIDGSSGSPVRRATCPPPAYFAQVCE